MTDRTITEIPIDELHDSPFNPPNRATLAIDELAANIKAEGRVHSALLVRPRTAGGFEIVYGHRRRYAAEAAGLATVPAEVRAMSDAEARSAQAAENVQRENLKALEEATAYRAMIDDDGLTADDVAKAIGKSRSHVYGRLRLLDLHPSVRTALQSGEVQGEVALLIARVGDEKMQAKALQVIRAHNAEIEDGGAKSYRRIRELLNEKFTLDLGKAIFNIEAEMLVPSAGHCLRCVKRTGNAPEYADVAGEKTAKELEDDEVAFEAKIEAAKDDDEADALYEERNRLSNGLRRSSVRHGGGMVCTDPDCFEAKVKAHLKAEAKRLEAEGATVITGGKARQAINARGELGEGYVVAAKIDLAKAKTEVKPVTIQNPRDGTTVQAYRAEDLQAAGVKVKAPKAKKSSGYDPQAYAREEARRREEAAAEEKGRRAILAAVREKAAETGRSEFDLRLVARAFFDQLDHHEKSLVVEMHGDGTVPKMHSVIDSMDAHTCGLLLLECAIVRHVTGGHWAMQEKPEALLAAAGYYGIDTDAVRQAVQTPATEPAAAPAKKGGKKGSKTAATEEQGELL